MGFDLGDPRLSPDSIVSGTAFSSSRVYGVVEADFFDWVLKAPGGSAFVQDLARRLSRFAWANVEHDVLKLLYESITRPRAARAGGVLHPGLAGRGNGGLDGNGTFTATGARSVMRERYVSFSCYPSLSRGGGGSGCRQRRGAGGLNADRAGDRRAPCGRNSCAGNVPVGDWYRATPGRPRCNLCPGVARGQHSVVAGGKCPVFWLCRHSHRRRRSPVRQPAGLPRTHYRRCPSL